MGQGVLGADVRVTPGVAKRAHTRALQPEGEHGALCFPVLSPRILLGTVVSTTMEFQTYSEPFRNQCESRGCEHWDQQATPASGPSRRALSSGCRGGVDVLQL